MSAHSSPLAARFGDTRNAFARYSLGTKEDMTASLEFALPDRISVVDENSLLPFLRDNPDAPLRISAARLRRLDTPLVQVLLAAAADRRARGIEFSLTGLTRDQAVQLSALGVTNAMLSFQVAE